VFAGTKWRKFSAHLAWLHRECFYIATYGDPKV
jgi:hypothetical protein